MARQGRPDGMRSFVVIWLGQVASLLGSAMTSFALIVFALRITDSPSVAAFVAVAAFGPVVVVSPFAGTLVDRWSRKRVIVLADLGAASGTAALLVLHFLGRLEVWHIYPAVAVAGAFGSFHFPAFSAAVTLMIPKAHYARASGMLSLAGSFSAIFAPPAAGILLETAGLGIVLALDLATFLIAVGMVLAVPIPQPAATEEGLAGRGSFLRETAYGFQYILKRPSLLGLQLVFFGVNLVASFAFILLYPMVLFRTAGDVLLLGYVLSAGAVGQVVGGLLLSVWGGPRRRIHGVLLGMVLASLFGGLVIGLGRGWVVWAAGNFLAGLFVIIVNGSNQAIWQSKVAPDVQGRVFAVRRLIAQVSAPLAMAAAGPLAEHVFEPGMQPGGGLAVRFGWLVGTGPGAGIGLMFVLTGVLGALVGAAGYAFRSVREVETVLPDHDAAVTEG